MLTFLFFYVSINLMGQQQLLLLVLGTVIVGIGVVAGFQGYTSSERNARKELANTRMAEIASMAIGWRTTPKAMNGGLDADGSSSFEGMTLSSIGVSDDEYLYLADGSCISCEVKNGGQQMDIQWQPNGDCGSGTDVLFKLEVTGITFADINYVEGDYNWD